MSKTATDLLRESYDDVIQGSIPDSDDPWHGYPWFENTRADSVPAGGYPPLPNFDSSDEPIWEAIFNWKTATPGADAGRKANKVENAIIETMRAYVDADRAALEATQASPVDATVQQDAERWQFFADYMVSTRTDLDDEIVGCDSVQKMARVFDAARAAQGGA